MLSRTRALRRFGRDQSGVAAVELALTLPFLLLLFIGIVNVADFITNRSRAAAATALLGDLVARHDAVISREDIDDYFLAARLSLGIRQTSQIGMEVRALRKSGGELAAAPRWSRGWRAGGGSQCPAPDLQSLSGVIENGRDIIVTVSCMTYQPPLASFLGSEILGFASTTINQQVATVPRKSPTLSCNDC